MSGAVIPAGQGFIDFDAYANGIYSPPPQLVALALEDPFWCTLGGSETDPFGDGGETYRQRLAAGDDRRPGAPWITRP